MSILALASSVMLATSSFAAEAGATEHEGVSLKPQMLVQFGGFGITNSMLVTWMIAAGIIIFAQIANRGFEVQHALGLNAGDWSPLNVPANAPFFSFANRLGIVPDVLPATTNRFYRVRVFEP